MNLDLTDEQSEALARLLRSAIDDDRYPLSPRVRTLQEILDQLRPPPPQGRRWGPMRRRAWGDTAGAANGANLALGAHAGWRGCPRQPPFMKFGRFVGLRLRC